MTLFIDASALVAIIRDEAEAPALQAAIGATDERITSGLAMWETARALGKAYENGAAEGWNEVGRYARAYRLQTVPIGADEAVEAFLAHTRYGKGSGHRAKLNMGDCFAYACAKINGARLLYKGDDFSQTDLA